MSLQEMPTPPQESWRETAVKRLQLFTYRLPSSVLVGAVLLVAVIPFTLIFLKPINDVLLDPTSDPDSAETASLLQRWGPKHWWRTAASGAAFLVYLMAAYHLQ